MMLILFLAERTSAQVNSLSEELIHSTIRIDCQYLLNDKSGKQFVKDGTGSGFVFTFDFLINGSDSLRLPVIVTNKHVIQNALKGKFHFTKKDSLGNPVYGEKEVIELSNFQNKWFAHPDPKIDLCIMPIGHILNQYEKEGKNVYYKSFSEKLIPQEEVWNSFTALEDILMIGYPIGLWDSKNNLPIIRKGQTATPMKIDYMGKEEFLLDIPAFPGSSGSPIILFNQGSYATNTGLAMGTRFYLVGVLYAGPMFDALGTGEISIHNLPVNFTTKTGIPINIGVSIKSNLLLDFKVELKKMFKN